MANKYSFQDTGTKHILYQAQMEQFDLSFAAITEFAFAVRNGDLGTLQTMFKTLTQQQQEGLLTAELDYSVLLDPFEWGIPRQTAVRHAQSLKHNDITQFLIDAKFDLTLNHIKSASTHFKSSFVLFPPDVAFPVGREVDEPPIDIKQGM